MAADGPRIGFLGAGRMATALAHGWVTAGLTTADRVLASDPLPQAREAFAAATGLRTTANNREVVAAADLLVLAVKPQTMKALLAEIQPVTTARHLIVSIAAGIPLRQLAEGLLTHDELAGRWRARHVQMVERQIGTKSGTGGSTGAPYLRGRVSIRYYPLLWELRDVL